MQPSSQQRMGGEGPVDGVVLAAGRSRRMGRAKALLELQGERFLERAIRVLAAAGCRSVLAVLNAADDAAIRAARAAGAGIVLNPHAGSEQVDSLRLAIHALPADGDAALVLPVDRPLVQEATARALIEAFRATRKTVVRPVCHGQAGHPTLFARSVLLEILETELPEGARSIIARHAADTHDVAVDDPGINQNIDTPEDYAALLSRLQQG